MYYIQNTRNYSGVKTNLNHRGSLSGHGDYSEKDQTGHILFEDPSGLLDRVPAKKLAETLLGFQSVRLVLATIIASSQLESNASIDKIKTDMDNLSESNFTNKEKSYALGYLILDLLGEKFLKNIFNDKIRQDYV